MISPRRGGEKKSGKKTEPKGVGACHGTRLAVGEKVRKSHLLYRANGKKLGKKGSLGEGGEGGGS